MPSTYFCLNLVYQLIDQILKGHLYNKVFPDSFLFKNQKPFLTIGYFLCSSQEMDLIHLIHSRIFYHVLKKWQNFVSINLLKELLDLFNF